mmetsp:Transcript_20727/g.36885  ORF Transcript_20727/g.36885 Transcript_20727/m.36885 type:complete len:495 (-) Transcript_20727:63-1547(-)
MGYREVAAADSAGDEIKIAMVGDMEHHENLVEDNSASDQPKSEMPVKRIGAIQAFSHIVRGNLGPGTLNLPFAFARVGVVRGIILLFVVSLQGVYSMTVLLKCKTILKPRGKATYMDVGYLAFGPGGRTVVQIFIAIMQLGVCCVFLQLVSTNLQAGLTGVGVQLDGIVCTLIVTGVLVCLSVLRYIRQLKFLTALGNLLMLVAILSSSTEAFITIVEEKRTGVGSGAPSDLFYFLTSMFYAYEGIAVILPIENSFCRGLEHDSQRSSEFMKVLGSSMLTISLLMLMLGASCGAAFPDIESGSVTAYLATTNSNPWYKIVNGITTLAVLVTFPLQLYPAIEVIESWYEGCLLKCRGSTDRANTEHKQVVSHQEDDDGGDELGEDTPAMNATVINLSYRRRKYTWAIRRVLVVLFCAGVTLLIDDLGLLLSLVGAIGSPGLVSMPSFIYFRLVYAGQMNVSILAIIANCLVVVFSVTVGGCGGYYAIAAIIEKHS